MAFLTLLLLTSADSSFACLLCRAKVTAGIHNPDFNLNFLLTLLPVFILTAIGLGFYTLGPSLRATQRKDRC